MTMHLYNVYKREKSQIQAYYNKILDFANMIYLEEYYKGQPSSKDRPVLFGERIGIWCPWGISVVLVPKREREMKHNLISLKQNGNELY